MEGARRNFSFGGLGILTLALVAVASCSSGSSTYPSENPASWEFLTYYDFQEQSTLRIEGDGSISVEGVAEEEAPDLGVLAPATWETLREAASNAEMRLIEVALRSVAQGIGIVRLEEGGRLFGFSWVSEEELSEGQRDLVELLRHLRDESRSPQDDRLDPVAVTTLLEGQNSAMVEPREAVVRDEDALLRLVGEALPGQTVVIPDVDFGSEMVVAIFLGAQRPQSALEIWDSARWTLAGNLRLTMDVGEAIGDCPKSWSPFQMMRLPKTSSELFILRNRVTYDCTAE